MLPDIPINHKPSFGASQVKNSPVKTIKHFSLKWFSTNPNLSGKYPFDLKKTAGPIDMATQYKGALGFFVPKKMCFAKKHINCACLMAIARISGQITARFTALPVQGGNNFAFSAALLLIIISNRQ